MHGQRTTSGTTPSTRLTSATRPQVHMHLTLGTKSHHERNVYCQQATHTCSVASLLPSRNPDAQWTQVRTSERRSTSSDKLNKTKSIPDGRTCTNRKQQPHEMKQLHSDATACKNNESNNEQYPNHPNHQGRRNTCAIQVHLHANASNKKRKSSGRLYHYQASLFLTRQEQRKQGH
jgi:hypothetical protein